jgi:hypothetical protein
MTFAWIDNPLPEQKTGYSGNCFRYKHHKCSGRRCTCPCHKEKSK